MTDKRLRVADYLEHVLAASARINRYTTDIDFEIIGEACRSIVRADPDFPARYPGLPLRGAMEMRNVLAHAYFGVDLSVVWRTIQTDLPGLERGVRQALSETRGD